GDLPHLRGDPQLRVTTGEPLLALPEGDTVRHPLPAESVRAWTGRNPPRSENSRLYAVPLSNSPQWSHAAIFHARPMHEARRPDTRSAESPARPLVSSCGT